MNRNGNHRVLVVPHFIVHSEKEFEEMEESFLREGFEGIIARDPQAPYKSGRATVTMNNYLRLKRRIDFEFTISGFTEAMENQNEKKTNALGQSERSSHKENLVPKGMVGNIQGIVLKDVEYRGKVLLQQGQPIVVGPGRMTHAERKAAWEALGTSETWVGKIGKALFMPHGQLDKPRIPTFESLRSKVDMS
jgi:DNA ligase-1